MNVGCAEIDGEICVNIYSGRDVCITSMTDCIFMIIDTDVQKMDGWMDGWIWMDGLRDRGMNREMYRCKYTYRLDKWLDDR